MDPKLFPARLRELRDEAGLTQTELAEMIGVGRDAIARWEGGSREPAWSYVLKLCEALGVDCTEFVKKPTTDPPKKGRPRKKKTD